MYVYIYVYIYIYMYIYKCMNLLWDLAGQTLRRLTCCEQHRPRTTRRAPHIYPDIYEAIDSSTTHHS